MFYDYPLTKRQLWPVGLFCSPWPEQALRANIHCQISLALNRIYTEWYPSKGYSFNITNSTSYDQYYVHGRTVFDVMVRLTDDIFNTYIRKTGTVNPYYAEYCDGKSVTCPGLKQWGTVTLANQGRSALSILKYYYGSNIEIIRTNNIQSIPQSYPGSPLRQGSTGAAVFTLQRQLNRITKDYPFLGLLTVDGIFGRKMTETVKKFQKQFNLTADGVALSEDSRARVVALLGQDLLTYCRHPHASNVVERLLDQTSAHCSALRAQVLSEASLRVLVGDPFGYYVVEAATHADA